MPNGRSVAAMIPPGRHGGRRRSVNVREVLNGIFYVLWTGCQWKALPKDLPPKSTVHDYLEFWNWDGTLERIHHALYVAVREERGVEQSPTVAIINSQSATGAQKGGLGLILRATTRARRSRVAKRHILVDTLGLLLNVVVHPADIQDRDGALHLLRPARRLFPFIERIFADGAYAGRKMAMTVWRARTGTCRSSSDRTLLDLRCCLNGGSSNERSRGLVVTVVWLATLNATQRPLLHHTASP